MFGAWGVCRALRVDMACAWTVGARADDPGQIVGSVAVPGLTAREDDVARPRTLRRPSSLPLMLVNPGVKSGASDKRNSREAALRSPRPKPAPQNNPVKSEVFGL